MARIRRIGNRFLATILIAVMAACIAWMLPALFGYSRYVITSGSMTGTYDQGSVVFEKQVPVSDLKVGDVITYMPPPASGVSHLVTHRIVSIQHAQGGGQLFTTKGDFNTANDPWHFKLTAPTQAVANFGVPHLGWVFIALSDRTTRMLIIGLPAALIGLGAFVQLVNALRRKEDRTHLPVNVPGQARPSYAEQELELI